MTKKLTAEERKELQFMLETVRDLRSMRARAKLGLLVAEAKSEAWHMMAGGKRNADLAQVATE
ncbi:hypothetical protein ES703_88679 [subsurface metagenome]